MPPKKRRAYREKKKGIAARTMAALCMGTPSGVDVSDVTDAKASGVSAQQGCAEIETAPPLLDAGFGIFA